MRTTSEVVAGRFLSASHKLLREIEETQMDAIEQVAALCADTIAAGGLVHMFGTGHSRIPLEEMFPRYGSYPGFHPIAELSMTFHTQVAGANGQRQAMFIERVHGLAEQILANFQFGENDLMMVFSASGRAAVPIEMAAGSRKRGMKVVAITSAAQVGSAEAAPDQGSHLSHHADLVIDICTPPADALISLEGLETPVGPGSTIAYAAIVNEIKVQAAALLLLRDALPPVITSPALVGRERSDELFEGAYREHGRRVGRLLSGNHESK